LNPPATVIVWLKSSVGTKGSNELSAWTVVNMHGPLELPSQLPQPMLCDRESEGAGSVGSCVLSESTSIAAL